MAGLALEHSDGTTASGSTQDTAVDGEHTPADVTVTVTAPSPTLPDALLRHLARQVGLHTAHPTAEEYSRANLTGWYTTTMQAEEDLLRATQHVPMSRFEELMATSLLPEPGPAHFAARRALWCRPMSFAPSSTQQNPRLLELLEQPLPLHSDEAWNKGMDKVWRGGTGGTRLKRRLPMKYLVRVTPVLQ